MHTLIQMYMLRMQSTENFRYFIQFSLASLPKQKDLLKVINNSGYKRSDILNKEIAYKQSSQRNAYATRDAVVQIVLHFVLNPKAEMALPHMLQIPLSIHPFFSFPNVFTFRKIKHFQLFCIHIQGPTPYLYSTLVSLS